jgi:hypothetical protein
MLVLGPRCGQVTGPTGCPNGNRSISCLPLRRSGPCPRLQAVAHTHDRVVPTRIAELL